MALRLCTNSARQHNFAAAVKRLVLARHSALAADEAQQRKLAKQDAQDRRDYCITKAEVRQLCDTTVRFDVVDPRFRPEPAGPSEQADEERDESAVRLGIDRAVVARCRMLQDAVSAVGRQEPEGAFRLRAELSAVLAWRDGPAACAAQTVKQKLLQLEVRRARRRCFCESLMTRLISALY